MEADADANAAVRDVEGGEVARADVEIEEVDDVAEPDAVDDIADDSGDEQHEGGVADCAGAENLLTVAREDKEHHGREGDKRDAPAREYAPGRAAVLNIREAEEAADDGAGLVEGEVATDLQLGELIERD